MIDTVDAAEFERLVVAELDLLPDDMIDGIENVGFVTQDRPDDGSLRLLGLYTGTRSAAFGGSPISVRGRPVTASPNHTRSA